MQLTVAQRQGPSAAKPPYSFPEVPQERVSPHTSSCLGNKESCQSVRGGRGTIFSWGFTQILAFAILARFELCRTTTLGAPRVSAAGEGRTSSLLCFKDVPE